MLADISWFYFIALYDWIPNTNTNFWWTVWNEIYYLLSRYVAHYHLFVTTVAELNLCSFTCLTCLKEKISQYWMPTSFFICDCTT